VNIHDDEDEHSFESSGMDREKVDGPDVLVSLEKAPPVLGALTVPRTNIGPPQNIADRGFRDIDSDFKEFAVNSFRAESKDFNPVFTHPEPSPQGGWQG
jgi:hypothetical protein